MANLYDIWFLVIGVFWTGFFILEGFDFGVGMLHSFVGRSDLERRIAVNSIGPIWDGNEVWLVVAGAATFAAFPAWYATMFSTFYLAMVLILVALIVRGMSFEFRGKITDPRWRGVWQWSLTIGSAVVPLLLGTALGDLLYGLPINQAGDYTGSFFGLLVPFGVFTGITLTVLCMFLGAAYLTLKTVGELHQRVARLSGRLGWVAAAVVLIWVVWSHVGLNQGFVPKPVDILALFAVLGAAWFAEAGSQGVAFTSGAVAIGSVLASIFFDLSPRVMVSSTNAAYSLTIAGTASPPYTLKVMTVIAVVFLPLVLAYQAWSLWTFRKRLGSPPTSTSAITADGAAAGAPFAPALPADSVSPRSPSTSSVSSTSTTTEEIP
jgi:cytochrome bd ubiquinol oxidase subunit II